MYLMGNYNRDQRSSSDRNFGRRDYGSRDGGRSFNRGEDRPMHKATCSDCGKECEVPFRPTNGKPVYCSNCFEKMRGDRPDSKRFERSDYRAPAFDQNKNQFDALHIKLDKILKILEPKIAAVVVPIETPKDDTEISVELKEIKNPKIKKAAKKLITPKE
jgi:CxxC-x17-CxxC domain-containing protein